MPPSPLTVAVVVSATVAFVCWGPWRASKYACQSCLEGDREVGREDEGGMKGGGEGCWRATRIWCATCGMPEEEEEGEEEGEKEGRMVVRIKKAEEEREDEGEGKEESSSSDGDDEEEGEGDEENV